MKQPILVFRMGLFGDTIVALPAMWAIRRHFAHEHIVLLCEEYGGKGFVLAEELLQGSGLFDEFRTYPWHLVHSSSRVRELWEQIKLFVWIRKHRFRTLVYLVPSEREPSQVRRDRFFFGLTGIRQFLGMEGFQPSGAGGTRQTSENETLEYAQLLRRLKLSGIPIPEPGHECLDLGLGRAEEEALNSWLATQAPDCGKSWIAVCPRSKVPVNSWPEDRYEAVVRALINEFDVWPIVLGGREERLLGGGLVQAWGRGYNLSGELGVRAVGQAMRRCIIYLGADTGPMHLAAALKIPCVAVFSARAAPSVWYPYGTGHTVLQARIECQDCRRTVCPDKKAECILRVSVDEVLAACRDTLVRRGLRPVNHPPRPQ